MEMLDFIALFAGALGVGFVSAIAGIGGGSLLVPFMVLLLGYDARVAIAASLLCVIITSSSAASEYIQKKMVDFKMALLLEPITTLGAIVGAHITLSLPTNYIEGVFGAMLLYVSITMLRKSLKETTAIHEEKNTSIDNILWKRKLAGLLVSFIAGLTSGMLGVGGGVLKVPILTLVMGVPIKVAVATSSFMIGLTAASGEVIYIVKGLTDPRIVAPLALGIIPGATLGARYLGKIKARYVRLVFSLLLLYASIRMLFSII